MTYKFESNKPKKKLFIYLLLFFDFTSFLKRRKNKTKYIFIFYDFKIKHLLF
jgi:hypothetical protein